MAAPRYAIYYAPAFDSALWRFGSGVIGYDANSGENLPFTPIPELDAERQRRITDDPRRYGFHATLKAPFHLTEGRDEAELLAMAANFAAQQPPGKVFPLKVTLLGRFVALTPAVAEESIAAIAAEAVEAFEHFRAPLSETDIARRKPDALSGRQLSNLQRWGYPYVFDEFRFHMTLTSALEQADRQPLAERLTGMFEEAVPDPAVSIDRIVLFRQEKRDSRFRIMRCFPLAARQDATA